MAPATTGATLYSGRTIRSPDQSKSVQHCKFVSISRAPDAQRELRFGTFALHFCRKFAPQSVMDSDRRTKHFLDSRTPRRLVPRRRRRAQDSHRRPPQSRARPPNPDLWRLVNPTLPRNKIARITRELLDLLLMCNSRPIRRYRAVVADLDRILRSR